MPLNSHELIEETPLILLFPLPYAVIDLDDLAGGFVK